MRARGPGRQSASSLFGPWTIFGRWPALRPAAFSRRRSRLIFYVQAAPMLHHVRRGIRLDPSSRPMQTWDLAPRIAPACLQPFFLANVIYSALLTACTASISKKIPSSLDACRSDILDECKNRAIMALMLCCCCRRSPSRTRCSTAATRTRTSHLRLAPSPGSR